MGIEQLKRYRVTCDGYIDGVSYEVCDSECEVWSTSKYEAGRSLPDDWIISYQGDYFTITCPRTDHS